MKQLKFMMSPEFYQTPVQKIIVEPIIPKGLVIDIGGGDEGIVARVGGDRVCVIDIKMDEILEAKIYNPPANWFVADGQALCFKEEVFDTATLWFSLGFMRSWKVKKKVLLEVYRVLRDGGDLSLIAARLDYKERKVFFKVHFVLPDGNISQVTYGMYANQRQTLKSIINLLKTIGFYIKHTSDHNYWFKIIGTKENKLFSQKLKVETKILTSHQQSG